MEVPQNGIDRNEDTPKTTNGVSQGYEFIKNNTAKILMTAGIIVAPLMIKAQSLNTKDNQDDPRKELTLIEDHDLLASFDEEVAKNIIRNEIEKIRPEVLDMEVDIVEILYPIIKHQIYAGVKFHIKQYMDTLSINLFQDKEYVDGIYNVLAKRGGSFIFHPLCFNYEKDRSEEYKNKFWNDEYLKELVNIELDYHGEASDAFRVIDTEITTPEFKEFLMKYKRVAPEDDNIGERLAAIKAMASEIVPNPDIQKGILKLAKNGIPFPIPYYTDVYPHRRYKQQTKVFANQDNISTWIKFTKFYNISSYRNDIYGSVMLGLFHNGILADEGNFNSLCTLSEHGFEPLEYYAGTLISEEKALTSHLKNETFLEHMINFQELLNLTSTSKDWRQSRLLENYYGNIEIWGREVTKEEAEKTYKEVMMRHWLEFIEVYPKEHWGELHKEIMKLYNQ